MPWSMTVLSSSYVMSTALRLRVLLPFPSNSSFLSDSWVQIRLRCQVVKEVSRAKPDKTSSKGPSVQWPKMANGFLLCLDLCGKWHSKSLGLDKALYELT